MQIETCQIGSVLRLGADTRVVIHRRQGERVCLGATAPAGTELLLGGASLRPIAGTPGLWSYLFSLHATRCFTLGRFEVHVWLPGELLPLAADCNDWLHVGIVGRASGDFPHALTERESVSPASVASAPPLFRTIDGCRPLLRSA